MLNCPGVRVSVLSPLHSGQLGTTEGADMRLIPLKTMTAIVIGFVLLNVLAVIVGVLS